MRQTYKLFLIGLKQSSKDGMLIALLIAPFLLGILFKLGIPYANSILENQLSFSLNSWYGLIDGFLICLNPMFMAIVCAFLLLEEYDEKIYAFYQITPVEGFSYIFSRIGIPMLWSLFSSFLMAVIFNISELSLRIIVLTSFISTFMGLALAMMVVSIAKNRVEGLVLSKLMGISILGLAVIWFIPYPYQLIAGFLPSYWIGSLIFHGLSFHGIFIGLFSCLLWIFIFTKSFLRKIE